MSDGNRAIFLPVAFGHDFTMTEDGSGSWRHDDGLGHGFTESLQVVSRDGDLNVLVTHELDSIVFSELQEDEQKRVDKELANIRKKFRNTDLSSYDKKK